MTPTAGSDPLAAARGEPEKSGAAAADVLKLDQPKVSTLVRGRSSGFSLGRLLRFVVLLGIDVEIVGEAAHPGDGPCSGAGSLKCCPKCAYIFRTAS
jgi:hypothetical protein